MAIIVEDAIHVTAAPSAVWRLLTDASSWKTWWKDCREARTHNLRPLREGSKLVVALQPRHRQFELTPEVDMITDGKLIRMTHHGSLLRGTVTWYLDESDRGTRVRVEAVFKGFGATLMRLVRQDDLIRFALRNNLRGLRKMAERIGA